MCILSMYRYICMYIYINIYINSVGIFEFDYNIRIHLSRSSRAARAESVSSGEEEEDDEGFHLLTAENLFSTLLHRVCTSYNMIVVHRKHADFLSLSYYCSQLFIILWTQCLSMTRVKNMHFRYTLSIIIF